MLTQYQRIARLCRQRLILEGEPVSWRREGSTEPELFLRSKPDGMVPSSEAIAYMPTFLSSRACLGGVWFLRAEPSLGSRTVQHTRRTSW